MADNVTFQTATTATPPDATIVETIDEGVGVERQVFALGGIGKSGAETQLTAGQKVSGTSIPVVLPSDQIVSSNISRVGGTAIVMGQAVAATSVPVVLPSDQIVSANISQVGGTAISLGQKIMATSLPVAIASNQIVSTNLSQIGGTAIVMGQAVAATSLPVVLPSDQIVSANISQVGGTAITMGQKAAATSVPVVLPSDQIVSTNISRVGGTAIVMGQAVAATSIPVVLPSDQIVSTNISRVGGTAIVMGQAVMATSLPVAVATNQATISVAQDSNALMSGASGTVLTPKFAVISVLATSGVNQVVASVASKKLRVIAWDLVANGAVNVKWQSNTTDITGLYYLAATGSGIARSWNPNGYFETAAATALNINLSATVAIGGAITYVEV